MSGRGESKQGPSISPTKARNKKDSRFSLPWQGVERGDMLEESDLSPLPPATPRNPSFQTVRERLAVFGESLTKLRARVLALSGKIEENSALRAENQRLKSRAGEKVTAPLFKGVMKEGERWGRGVLFEGGVIQRGEFEAGRLNGRGSLTFSTHSLVGHFVDGRLVGPEVILKKFDTGTEIRGPLPPDFRNAETEIRPRVIKDARLKLESLNGEALSLSAFETLRKSSLLDSQKALTISEQVLPPSLLSPSRRSLQLENVAIFFAPTAQTSREDNAEERLTNDAMLDDFTDGFEEKGSKKSSIVFR